MNIAVVGAGTAGNIHAQCLAQVADAQVSAICTRSPEQGAAVAAAIAAAGYLSPRVFPDLATALRDASVDVVDVASYTPDHLRQTEIAAAAGKAVICEKPIARTLAEADRMIAACQQAGVGLYIAHVLRFAPDMLQLHDRVKEGTVGIPAVLRMARRAQMPHGRSGWHADYATSGGVLLDMLIHDLDWALWTLGPVARVFARGLNGKHLPALDYVQVTLNFANGAIGYFEGSWAEVAGFHACGEIAGSDGLLQYDDQASSPYHLAVRVSEQVQPEEPAASQAEPIQDEARSTRDEKGKKKYKKYKKRQKKDQGSTAETQNSPLPELEKPETPKVLVPDSGTRPNPFVLQFGHFLQCIRGDVQPVITVSEARAALALAVAAQRSLDTGQAVLVDS